MINIRKCTESQGGWDQKKDLNSKFNSRMVLSREKLEVGESEKRGFQKWMSWTRQNEGC
jgi:hypothetical protein